MSSLKIYNKKGFGSGMFSFVVGLALLISMLATGNWRPKSVVLCVLCLLLGAGAVTRSLSRDKAIRDLIDERDERNILVALRTKSTCFTVLRAVLFVLCIACALGVAFHPVEEARLILAGVLAVTGLLWFFSFVLELICSIHYDNKL